MGKSLSEIAQELKECNKKVQLIYAFNGTGKTRLSQKFKMLVELRDNDNYVTEKKKILYYNAFTEDLFFWDNDLLSGLNPKIVIRPNSFTNWILKEQGHDQNIIGRFQYYTSSKITPRFSPDFTEIRFPIVKNIDGEVEYIKISKGEESSLFWCVFFVLLEQVIETLKEHNPDDRDTDEFDELEYVFIDDPVTSLDDNHLIQLAIDLAKLIKDSPKTIKFIITTHNPIFYNVLHSELNENTKNKECYLLEKIRDGTYELINKKGDSNSSFSYHLHLKTVLQNAIEANQIEKYHFTLLRNLYEKTASFLGFPRWAKLLPGGQEEYYRRIIQFTSHSTISSEVATEPSTQEKEEVKVLFDHLISSYGFFKETNK